MALPQTIYIRFGRHPNVRTETDKNSKLVVSIKKKGTQVAALGSETGKGGNVWYHVEYLSNGKTYTGYIREDFGEVDNYFFLSSVQLHFTINRAENRLILLA